MEAQAKGYIELMEQRRLARLAEDEEIETIHNAEQNKIDDEIDKAQQPVFDTEKQIAAVEKVMSELRDELKRQEGKVRDCHVVRTSLAVVAENERQCLENEKERACTEHNSRIQELKGFREQMDAVEKDKFVSRLLETFSRKVRIDLSLWFAALLKYLVSYD
jgi:hypothetical protein